MMLRCNNNERSGRRHCGDPSDGQGRRPASTAFPRTATGTIRVHAQARSHVQGRDFEFRDSRQIMGLFRLARTGIEIATKSIKRL
jgi:hypothetical protein